MRRAHGGVHPGAVRVAAVLSAVLLAGCGQTGSATTRIDEAEQEISGLVASIVETVELEVTSERPLGTRQRCELVTGRRGASNTLSIGGPIPAVDDPLGRSRAILDAAGYELLSTDLPDEVFGRRDGIRITVFEDRATGRLVIDAATACRPLPAT